MMRMIAGWCIACLVLSCLAGCAGQYRSDTVKVLDEALTALNSHGVTYELTISGQTSGEVYAKQSFGAGTPGWIYATIRGPSLNPAMELSGPHAPVTP